MTYKGSCHCGRIAFEVEGEIGTVYDCNCSMCQRRGGLLWFVPRERLKLLTAEADMGTYTFNKHALRHYFCPACGIRPLQRGQQGRQGACSGQRALPGGRGTRAAEGRARQRAQLLIDAAVAGRETAMRYLGLTRPAPPLRSDSQCR